MNQHNVTLSGALLIAAAISMSACAPTTPRWDASFGTSVRTSVASQVMHAEAVRNTNPVSGMDGKAAVEAHRSYVKSFAMPERAPAPMTAKSE